VSKSELTVYGEIGRRLGFSGPTGTESLLRAAKVKRQQRRGVHTAAYLRASTPRQCPGSLDRQYAYCCWAAARPGVPPVGVTYTDICSGAKTKRPGLELLLFAVRAGRLSYVFVEAMDRLTRAGWDHAVELQDEFDANGVTLVSVFEEVGFPRLLGGACDADISRHYGGPGTRRERR